MIECAIWWAEPLPNDPRYLEFLDEAERGRHTAYRMELDKRRFLTGRVLSKTIAGERLGRDPKSISFDATCTDCGKQHGPPSVPGSELKLSISHSGDRIGLAVTEATPVGLDVESRRKADDSLIEYTLTPPEVEAIHKVPASEKEMVFFQYWTRKEALMKATGKGLRIPPSAITLSGPGEPARLVHSTDAALDPARLRLIDLDPGEGYRAAVALITEDEVKVTEHPWPA
ncbi:4'-phosphopantetheinyl transferase family protein [Amycolatopsis sp. CA-230715]|uniref:4'-phosphopantetheinyl transferase family protein n=1 Tax=Amycolatopsis sp. CA-230715 TaxID=2745196 RepID=UPI001C027616|nr:4'-phosphopantetheinyl transferase superfamily protein [Amycolatopsis sp. CA-230715]QWF81789.1 4'-phosphopantetheinyl transferase Sfp [Amycolatopsis sp. CA-230715]